MDEPLLDADPGGDSRDALSSSWLEPQNDALHHAPLMSGGHEGEAPASDPWSWATHPTPAEAGGSPGPARLLLGARLASASAALALVSFSLHALLRDAVTLSPARGVLAACGILLGLLLLAHESGLPFLRRPLTDSFGFLSHPVLRMGFHFVLIPVAWSYGGIRGEGLALALLAVGAGGSLVILRDTPSSSDGDADTFEDFGRLRGGGGFLGVEEPRRTDCNWWMEDDCGDRAK